MKIKEQTNILVKAKIDSLQFICPALGWCFHHAIDKVGLLIGAVKKQHKQKTVGVASTPH